VPCLPPPKNAPASGLDADARLCAVEGVVDGAAEEQITGCCRVPSRGAKEVSGIELMLRNAVQEDRVKLVDGFVGARVRRRLTAPDVQAIEGNASGERELLAHNEERVLGEDREGALVGDHEGFCERRRSDLELCWGLYGALLEGNELIIEVGLGVFGWRRCWRSQRFSTARDRRGEVDFADGLAGRIEHMSHDPHGSEGLVHRVKYLCVREVVN